MNVLNDSGARHSPCDGGRTRRGWLPCQYQPTTTVVSRRLGLQLSSRTSIGTAASGLATWELHRARHRAAVPCTNALGACSLARKHRQMSVRLRGAPRSRAQLFRGDSWQDRACQTCTHTVLEAQHVNRANGSPWTSRAWQAAFCRLRAVGRRPPEKSDKQAAASRLSLTSRAGDSGDTKTPHPPTRLGSGAYLESGA